MVYQNTNFKLKCIALSHITASRCICEIGQIKRKLFCASPRKYSLCPDDHVNQGPPVIGYHYKPKNSLTLLSIQYYVILPCLFSDAYMQVLTFYIAISRLYMLESVLLCMYERFCLPSSLQTRVEAVQHKNFFFPKLKLIFEPF